MSTTVVKASLNVLVGHMCHSYRDNDLSVCFILVFAFGICLWRVRSEKGRSWKGKTYEEVGGEKSKLLSYTELQHWLPWDWADAARGDDVSMLCGDSERSSRKSFFLSFTLSLKVSFFSLLFYCAFLWSSFYQPLCWKQRKTKQTHSPSLSPTSSPSLASL